MAAATEDLKTGTVSMTSTVKKYNIPKSTLTDHMNNNHMLACGRLKTLTLLGIINN